MMVSKFCLISKARIGAGGPTRYIQPTERFCSVCMVFKKIKPTFLTYKIQEISPKNSNV